MGTTRADSSAIPTDPRLQLDRIVRVWLDGATERVVAAADELTALDARIGDGDHGINLSRGMRRVRGLVGDLDVSTDPAGLLRAAGRALVSSVGGASGPLYGTFLLDAADGLGPGTGPPLASLATALERGAAGIGRRGRSTTGQKTMLDTLVPAAVALRRAVDGVPSDGAGAVRALLAAARDGCESTRPMVAQRGRASYLGERAVGHLDPGAVSALLVVEALAAALGDQPAGASDRLSR